MAGVPDMEEIDPHTRVTWDDDDGDNDEEETNTTQPFQPGAASTPSQPPGAPADPYHGGESHEMTNFGPEESGISETTPLFSPQSNQAWALTEAVYPDADPTALDVFYEEMRDPDPNSTKRLRLMIKMKDAGKKAYPLYTRDRVTGKERINPNLPVEIAKALGKKAETEIADVKRLKKEAKERAE